MRRARWLMLAALWFCAVAAQAQAILFFEQENLRGRSFGASTNIDNFQWFGFNDRASSVTIGSQRWQLCTDAYFRGRCVTLAPGTYRTLAAMGLNNRISSARIAGGPGGGSGGGWANAPVVFYQLENFAGPNFPVSTAISNFEQAGFNDNASSINVRSGRWQICSDAYYRGDCRVLGPGTYRTLSSIGFNNRVSSIRPMGGSGSGGGGPGGGPALTTITLFDRPGLNGQNMTIGIDVSNLAGMIFNNRVHSITVQGGRWMLCSEPNFRGKCRTFEPGRYPNLGSLSGRVSSLRRT